MTDEEKRAETQRKRREYTRRWREENPDKVKAQRERWLTENRDRVNANERARYAADPSKAAAKQRRRLYGITQDQFDAMLSDQNFSCAICGTKEPGGVGKTFHVDHCHSSGEVRGLLCYLCNAGLGSFRDNTVFLKHAIGYLEDARH